MNTLSSHQSEPTAGVPGTNRWLQVIRRSEGPDGDCKTLRGHEYDDMDICLHIMLYHSDASSGTVSSMALGDVSVSHLVLYWQIMLVKLNASQKECVSHSTE